MKKHICKHIVILILIIAVASPVIYHNIKNNMEFFKTSLTTIVSAISVVYVSFYLVQWRTDTREKIKHVETIIYDIKSMLNSDEMYTVSTDEERRKALILQRKVANKIAVLEEYEFNPKVNEQVKRLKENYKELREFIGENINDSDYIKKSKNEIERRTAKIDNILDLLCVKLHK